MTGQHELIQTLWQHWQTRFFDRFEAAQLYHWPAALFAGLIQVDNAEQTWQKIQLLAGYATQKPVKQFRLLLKLANYLPAAQHNTLIAAIQALIAQTENQQQRDYAYAHFSPMLAGLGRFDLLSTVDQFSRNESYYYTVLAECEHLLDRNQPARAQQAARLIDSAKQRIAFEQVLLKYFLRVNDQAGFEQTIEQLSQQYYGHDRLPSDITLIWLQGLLKFGQFAAAKMLFAQIQDHTRNQAHALLLQAMPIDEYIVVQVHSLIYESLLQAQTDPAYQALLGNDLIKVSSEGFDQTILTSIEALIEASWRIESPQHRSMDLGLLIDQLLLVGLWAEAERVAHSIQDYGFRMSAYEQISATYLAERRWFDAERIAWLIDDLLKHQQLRDLVDKIDHHYLIIKAYLVADQLDRAINLAATVADPIQQCRSWAAIGCYQAQTDRTAALPLLQQAADLVASFVVVELPLVVLVQLLIQANQLLAAADLALHASEHPAQAKALYLLVVALIEAGHLSHAVTCARRIPATFYYSKAFNQLIAGYVRANNVAMAEALVHEVREGMYQQQALLQLALSLLEAGQRDASLALLPRFEQPDLACCELIGRFAASHHGIDAELLDLAWQHLAKLPRDWRFDAAMLALVPAFIKQQQFARIASLIEYIGLPESRDHVLLQLIQADSSKQALIEQIAHPVIQIQALVIVAQAANQPQLLEQALGQTNALVSIEQRDACLALLIPVQLQFQQIAEAWQHGLLIQQLPVKYRCLRLVIEELWQTQRYAQAIEYIQQCLDQASDYNQVFDVLELFLPLSAGEPWLGQELYLLLTTLKPIDIQQGLNL